MSVGVIINDRSDRSASVMTDIRAVCARHDSVRLAVLHGIDGLSETLADLDRQGDIDTLVIGGGDGTLQAVFTDVFNNARFARQPRYVALPCGMTNVIANDCGLSGPPAQGLDDFLKRQKTGNIQSTTRHLMALRNGAADPLYGFFFGAAAFYSAVEFSRAKVQSLGAKRSAVLMFSTLSFLLNAAFNREASIQSIDLDIMASDSAHQVRRARQFLYMATTLHKVGSGIFPFWGQGAAPMAVTTVLHPGQRLLRAAPAVLRAKSRPWFQEFGYESWKDSHLETRFDGPFVFDGEIFEAQAQAAMRIETDRQAEFVY